MVFPRKRGAAAGGMEAAKKVVVYELSEQTYGRAQHRKNQMGRFLWRLTDG